MSKPMVVAIIQARMGSTRLPGKVLKTLGSKTVLSHVVDRVRLCSRIDHLVVATSNQDEDDAIVDEAKRLGVSFFRGEAEDVLSRFFFAAQEAKADVVIRITADCPLMDGGVINRMLEKFLGERERVDYFSNTMKRTFPRGLDVEIFNFLGLERAFQGAKSSFEREHVTPYLYRNPDIFRLESFEQDRDQSHLRWTLDTPEDWNFLEAVFHALDKPGNLFSTADVLDLMGKSPQLTDLNAHVAQKK